MNRCKLLPYNHSRVHPPLPDPRPAGRFPPHPALRIAGHRSPQDRYREDPHPARDAAITADRRSGGRGHTIPLTLREPRPCCGGPMRIIEIFRRGQNRCREHHPGNRPHRLSSVRKHHRLPAADPAHTACGCCLRSQLASPILPASRSLSGPLSEITADPSIWRSFRRTPGATVAPAVCTLSP